MAKNKDAAYDAFLADIKAINPQVEEILKDERVATKLREATLARSEFSSQMDALRQEREQMQTYLQTEKQKISEWQNWYNTATREVADMQTKLNTYESEFGTLEPGQKPNRLTEDDVQKKIAAEFQQRENAFLKFTSDLNRISTRHAMKFREELDTDALYKICGEKNISLEMAYNEFIQPKVEEMRTKELERKLEEAKAEGAREALTKHRLPQLDSNPSYAGVHVVDAQSVGNTDMDRIAAATAAWRKAQETR